MQAINPESLDGARCFSHAAANEQLKLMVWLRFRGAGVLHLDDEAAVVICHAGVIGREEMN